jgi:hypothetical protein
MGVIYAIERLPGLPESMYDAIQWLSDEAREREWERRKLFMITTYEKNH